MRNAFQSFLNFPHLFFSSPMSMAPKIGYLLLLCLQLSQAINLCIAQSNGLDARQWVVKLSTIDNSGNEAARKLDSILDHLDSSRVFQFLQQLQEKGKSGGDHFNARFNCVKARQVLFQYRQKAKLLTTD